MFIIKVGGSVFAPKQSKSFNIDLLKKISSIISNNYKKQVILIHGTGNIGHDFVNKYGVTDKTFQIYKDIRKGFYKKMEDIFIGYERILAEDILENLSFIFESNKNYIISGDINSNNLDIISSDKIFGFLLKKYKNSKKIILTDVPGVLDDKNKLINNLKLSGVKKLKFWDKTGDVTDGMRGKLFSLNNCLFDYGEGVWIIDGNNTSNFENIILKGKGDGTYITK